MGIKIYFAYGSNMNPERMKERGVNFLSRKRAILYGWRLEFNKEALRNPKEGYANIVKDENSFVEGCIYEIKEDDFKKLDKYEGYPEHYYRVEVKVRMDDGDEVDAITYVANPNKVKEGLKPSKEYLDHLLKGSDLLSDDYINKLKAIETLD